MDFSWITADARRLSIRGFFTGLEERSCNPSMHHPAQVTEANVSCSFSWQVLCQGGPLSSASCPDCNGDSYIPVRLF